MPSGKNELKTSNVNYVGKDFEDLRTSLVNYAKSYFPNSYKDFNETSPGMMLLEMSAYVGDVLNFYVDQQYREMLLPLSENRRNLVLLAKSSGYKIKASTPAYATLTVKNEIPGSDGKPHFGHANCVVIDKGMKVVSATSPAVIFETLDIVDFKVSSSADVQPVVSEINDAGVPNKYILTRKVAAVAGESKSVSFTIGPPEKFKKIILEETNIIDIIKVKDSNGNIWHEVSNLAQDRIPISKHYTDDADRTTAYNNIGSSETYSLPVPYSLEYTKTSKRFTVETDENSKTYLNFGNGILKNGQSFSSQFLAVEQQGINLPGGEENLNSSIDPLMGDAYGTLGEAPAHTILTITYRVGGGIQSNVSANDLTIIDTIDTLPSSGGTPPVTVTNIDPAGGGSAGETLEDIRYKAMAQLYTQDRCVTKEDYEARTLTIPARYGNIAKVYAIRSGTIRTAQRKKVENLVDRL